MLCASSAYSPASCPQRAIVFGGCCMQGADIDGALLRHCKYLELVLHHLFKADIHCREGKRGRSALWIVRLLWEHFLLNSTYSTIQSLCFWTFLIDGQYLSLSFFYILTVQQVSWGKQEKKNLELFHPFRLVCSELCELSVKTVV